MNQEHLVKNSWEHENFSRLKIREQDITLASFLDLKG